MAKTKRATPKGKLKSPAEIVADLKTREPKTRIITVKPPAKSDIQKGQYIFPNERIEVISGDGNCRVLVSISADEFTDHFAPETDDNFQSFWSQKLFGTAGAIIHGVGVIGKPITQEGVEMIVCEVRANVAGITKTFIR